MDGRRVLLFALLASASLPALAPAASAHAYCPAAGTSAVVLYVSCSDPPSFARAACVTAYVLNVCNPASCPASTSDPCALLRGGECFAAGATSVLGAQACSPMATSPRAACFPHNPDASTNLCLQQGERRETAFTPPVAYTTPGVPPSCNLGDPCTPSVPPQNVGFGAQFAYATRPSVAGYVEATAACSAGPCRATLP